MPELMAEENTGASTRRGKKRGKKPRKKSSSSGKLLKSLTKKLDDLAQAEAQISYANTEEGADAEDLQIEKGKYRTLFNTHQF